MGQVVVPMPGVAPDIFIQARCCQGFRMHKGSGQLFRGQSPEQVHQFGMYRLQVVEGKPDRGRTGIEQGGPAFFVIGLDGGVFFGQGPFEAHIAVVVAVGQVVHHLPGRPPFRAVGRIQALIVPVLHQPTDLARQGFDVGKIDGVIGASTRDAIRKMQIKYGLPADSYPSHALLNRLQRGR